jgi:hypothetical protein
VPRLLPRQIIQLVLAGMGAVTNLAWGGGRAEAPRGEFGLMTLHATVGAIHGWGIHGFAMVVQQRSGIQICPPPIIQSTQSRSLFNW